MSAIRRNITVDYATDYNLNLLYKDAAGNPINLSGYTITWEVKKHEGYNTPLSATPVTGTAAGEIQVRLPESVTTLSPNRYYYNLKLVSGAGETTWLLWGNFNVNGADRS